MSQTVAETVLGKKVGGWRRGVAAMAALLAVAAIGPATARGTSWTFSERDGQPISDAELKVDPSIDRTASRVEVIVSTFGTAEAEIAARSVVANGGTVGKALQVAYGFVAKIDPDSIDLLATDPGVRAISANHPITFEEMSYDAATIASNFVKTSAAGGSWQRGILGEGIGVAVLDTGASSMNDLSGRLVHGPDLSGEGTTIDTYGHGTVMAGIIGGSGADSATRAGGAFTGVAPRATVVAVKVAGRNGVTDVSTVLEAMHWISAYKNQFNIRVLNLSWGTMSTQSPEFDPVNYAVERLWKQGIVVVVAAGNSGNAAGTITKPADDPLVLTVGAFNDQQNSDPADDNVPAWSSRGPTRAGLVKPDLVAPGRLLTASRSFGSTIEANYPKATVSPSYIRGSGTSQAAAVTSGIVALLLQARPSLTPDQVKALLRGAAVPIASVDANTQGKGRLTLEPATTADPGPASWQTFNGSGLGSIDASRGGYHVQTDCNQDGTTDVIEGEITYRCEAWNPAAWTGNSWTGNSWTGNSWTGNSWTGNSWTGNSWTSASWTGNSWTGGTWTGNSWTGNSWTGNSWTGNSWTGNSWTGNSWTGNSWTGNSWTGNSWTGNSWAGNSWAGNSWAGNSWAGKSGEVELLTAFWGDRPVWWETVPGEAAEAIPAWIRVRL